MADAGVLLVPVGECSLSCKYLLGRQCCGEEESSGGDEG